MRSPTETSVAVSRKERLRGITMTRRTHDGRHGSSLSFIAKSSLIYRLPTTSSITLVTAKVSSFRPAAKTNAAA
jgi:hypothetical protein